VVQVKRVPGSSGRVHKNTEGEWVWSDDEMKDTANETAAEPVNQSLLFVYIFWHELMQRCCGHNLPFYRYLAASGLPLPPDLCSHQLEFQEVELIADGLKNDELLAVVCMQGKQR